MRFQHRDLWDTKHVKQELVAGRVLEGKAFAYFFAIMAFDWLQFTAFRLSPSAAPPSAWERADALITFGLTLCGLAFLFLCNGGIRGQQFLQRYFGLSFVVGWKMVILSFVALAAHDMLMHDASPALVGWGATGVLAVLNVIMMLRIGWHMRALANASDMQDHRSARVRAG
jgi:hypothetical protein